MKHPLLKHRNIAILSVVGAVLAIVAVLWGSYNSLVVANAGVEKAWADVETQYQRRFDLIPNLVNVAESYAGFERQTLTDITELRTRWQTSTGVNDRIQTANQFESTLSKLLLITENYPQLRAGDQFTRLQDSLSETENMVSVSRNRFNEAVRVYNLAVRTFPSSIVAAMFGFESKEYFSSVEGSEAAPVVDINIPQ